MKTRIPKLAACVIAAATACFAHPMGNFSINHYSKLSVGQKSVQVTYAIDMAEIPTFQEMRQFNLKAEPESAEVGSYLAEQERQTRSRVVASDRWPASSAGPTLASSSVR